MVRISQLFVLSLTVFSSALCQPTDMGTRPGGFPWSVIFMDGEHYEDDWGKICFGVLIHPQVALGASFCFELYPDRKWIARAGDWEPQAAPKEGVGQTRKVLRWVTHPSHGENCYMNALTLVIVESAFQLTSSVQFIRMAGEQNFTNSLCTVAVWGLLTYDDSPAKDSVLMSRKKHIGSVAVKVRNTWDCEQSCPEQRMCAVREGGDTDDFECRESLGSGLVCPGGSGHVLKGLDTLTRSCEGVPNTYLDIPRYKAWIHSTMAAHKSDIQIQGAFG